MRLESSVCPVLRQVNRSSLANFRRRGSRRLWERVSFISDIFAWRCFTWSTLMTFSPLAVWCPDIMCAGCVARSSASADVRMLGSWPSNNIARRWACFIEHRQGRYAGHKHHRYHEFMIKRMKRGYRGSAVIKRGADMHARILLKVQRENWSGSGNEWGQWLRRGGTMHLLSITALRQARLTSLVHFNLV